MSIPHELSNHNSRSFCDILYSFLKEKKLNYDDLFKLSNLSPATITRIKKNTDYHGHPYTPTWEVVVACSIGLGLTAEERDQLWYAAHPEEHVYDYAMTHHLDIDKTNELLYDLGHGCLGRNPE